MFQDLRKLGTPTKSGHLILCPLQHGLWPVARTLSLPASSPGVNAENAKLRIFCTVQTKIFGCRPQLRERKLVEAQELFKPANPQNPKHIRSHPGTYMHAHTHRHRETDTHPPLLIIPTWNDVGKRRVCETVHACVRGRIFPSRMA